MNNFSASFVPSGNSTNGIFNFLTSYYINSVIASSRDTVFSGSFISLVTNPGSEMLRIDSPNEGIWIQFEFPSCLVCPTNYTLVSAKDYAFPLEWKLEGSMSAIDGTWTIFDQRPDGRVLCPTTDKPCLSKNTVTFMNQFSCVPSKYIRFTMIGPASSFAGGIYYFRLTGFELFGEIKSLIMQNMENVECATMYRFSSFSFLILHSMILILNIV